MMQYNLNGSYFENEEGIDFSNGVYFKYDSGIPSFEGGCKTLQVFSQILTIGQTTLVFTTLRDMSYWLDLEKKKNLSKLQSIAFASAAHEFKNPLGAIVSSLDILEPLVDNP